MDENYLQLALTMLVALENFKYEDLRINKDDVTKIIMQHNLLEKRMWNERGTIVLWRNDYLTSGEFAKMMEIEYEDNEFWIVAESFEDIIGECTEAEILDSNLKWYHSDYYHVNVSDFWLDYTKETLKAIIDFCIKKGFEINDVLMTSENLKLIDGDIYFNDTKLIDLIDESDLDNLRTSLNSSIIEAQDSADQNYAYKKVKKAFKNNIGDYKWKKIKIDGKDKNMLYVKVDINKIEQKLIDHYGTYEFIDEDYGNLFYAMKDFDMFKIDVNLEYLYGDIDNTILNEYTQSRLDWD